MLFCAALSSIDGGATAGAAMYGLDVMGG